ncbi:MULTISPECIES: trigger factor [Clostridium]|uniref:Trigger factor n=3 Tax=Clostridium TaxID=1485 RepID=A0A0A7FUN3_9CLOT|nr:trigger factor [Clostridium baratii]AIY82665.1 trigger factor [Clostridium baratii str. Sullivan]AQM59802.1 trigger factor [Clostridium baratii]KJU72617.1 trigger factor [Clostridium baratii]MBS6005643.1 trigger factor [Clostridium baratii]MBS6042044.1 trigger factor [Clostridium baratii]
MEAKMEKIEANVVKFEVRVEAEKFTAALNKAYNKNKKNFNIPGFRKGKVPMAMVKKHYGVEVLFEDAINTVVSETYPTLIEENKLKPIDYPKIDVVEIGEGKDLVYTAEVTLYPEIELGEYKGLDIKRKEVKVEDVEVEGQLKNMQQQNARVEVKEEGNVENGDIAVIDFKGFVDGVAFEGGEAKDYALEIGSGSFIDNFEDQLVGMATGEKKEIKVNFPENYGKEDLNGKEATFEVTVNQIKVKEMPALDDEFAKEVSEFETLDELKADITKKIEETKKASVEREFEDELVTAVIENSKMDIPEIMVEKEIDMMVRDLENRLRQQGLSLEQYMQFTGNTEEKMRSYMKENADKKVKADLVLEAIAKAENIEATDEEIKEKANEIAKIYAPDQADKMAEMLMQTQSNMIAKDLVVSKTIKFLEENCK